MFFTYHSSTRVNLSTAGDRAVLVIVAASVIIMIITLGINPFVSSDLTGHLHSFSATRLGKIKCTSIVTDIVKARYGIYAGFCYKKNTGS
jgi:hypothetical protein